jgi:hypothetical protein
MKKQVPMKKHETHKFKMWGHRGMAGTRGKTFICERCSVEGCKEQRERPATEAERKKIAAGWARHEAQQKLMHKAWRPAQKLMDEYKGVIDQGRKCELMSKLERLSEKFPEHIFYVRVDDDAFSGSDLWFFPHWYDSKASGKGFWGTTVVFIPQCADDPFVRFFLYPTSHMRPLLAMLKKFDAMERKLNKGKNYWDR